ncbi:MAG TPA: hypothetical protein VKY26_01965 [Actinomycetota bacterium]|nr:hypothetical protein [Actinomycetota bacterium]
MVPRTTDVLPAVLTLLVRALGAEADGGMGAPGDPVVPVVTVARGWAAVTI